MPVVPVFVSSTFVDFHGERDVIRSRVAPALDDLLRPLGARVELLDLRWGVDTAGVDEEAAHQRVLDVCIDEVDRCRPLFVGLVGDRFGWVPPESRLELAGARSSVRTAPPDVPGGLSVTALEFWHGALAPDATAEAVVAVRELAGEVPALWRSADARGVQWLRSAVVEAAGRAPGRVSRFTYPACVEATPGRKGLRPAAVRAMDLDRFAQRLIDELTPRVLAQVAELGRAQQSGYPAAAGLLAESRSVAVGRDDLVSQLIGLLSGPDSGLVLLGRSGVGKTTVALAAAEKLEASGWTVARVLVGAGPGSTSTADVIAILAEQIGVVVPTSPATGRGLWGSADAVAAKGPAVQRLGRDDLLGWWWEVLTCLQGRTLLVLDGVDRLDAGDARDAVEVLRWVPSGGVRVLASTTEAAQAQILWARGIRPLEVDPLDRQDAAAAARALALADGRRALPEPVVDVLAGLPRTGLWLRLAVTELSWLDRTDFARAEAARADPAAAVTGLLLDEASALPAQESALAERLLERAAAELGQAHLAGLLLGALALTRSGLTPADLVALSSGSGDSQLPVVRARQLLGAQLVARDSQGRLGFDHQVVRDAALARAVSSGWSEAGLHARLAEHFASGAGGAAFRRRSPDRTAALDRLWHSLLTGDASTIAKALELTDIYLTLSEAAEVIALAVTSDRNREGVVIRGLDALGEYPFAGAGCLRQLGNALIEYGETHLTVEECRTMASALHQLASRGLHSLEPANPREAKWRRRLWGRRPSPAEAQITHDVSVSLNKVAEVALRGGDLAGARAASSWNLEIARRLAARYPRNAQAARDVRFSLNTVGRVARVAGDLAGARAAHTESLEIARRLAAADPGNALTARSVSVSLNDVGRVAMAGGDLGAARTAYTESLQIARGLAAADPGNAQAARDVSVSLWRLAELLERSDGFGSPAVRAAWADVVAQFDTMRDRGWIMPVDERFESQARLKAGGGGDDQDAQVPGAVTG